MSSNYTIYTGHVWKDYGSNKWILTLNGASAGVLQSIIPIFITLVGPVTWIIIKYTWYQVSLCVRRRTPNYYYRQKQVLLRNSTGDLGTVKDAIGLFWIWRVGNMWQSLWRAFPLLLVALIFFFACQVAGIVSFYIWQTTVPTVALIRGSVCGTYFVTGPSASLAFRRMGISETIQAETYVTQCYGSSSSGACSVYSSQSIAFNESDTTCPFQSPAICINTNSTPYQLDSGPINSHTDLGINAPPSNRVTYQKLTTCSPVHSSPFAHIVWANETDEVADWPSDTRLQQFYFGPITDANFSYTFEYSEWAPEDGFGYDISGYTYNPGASTIEAWVPNSTFTNRTDADVTIFFFTPNSVVYNFEVYDPIFQTGASYSFLVEGVNKTIYTPTFFVNTLGCIDQHKFCNPTISDPASGCTPFAAYNQIPDLVDSIQYNPTQLATAGRILSNLELINTFNSVDGRRAAAILASQTVDDNLQVGFLSVDQWRIEVANWFAVSLAKLQQGILEFAAGPTDPEFLSFVQYPTNPVTAQLCYNQLVQLPSGYTNFDFGVIVIITIVGFMIVIMGLYFTKVLGWALRRRGVGWQREWIHDGQFQLLKHGYELEGVGGWLHEDEEIPITREDLRPGPADSPGLVQGHGSPQAPSRANSSSPDSAHQTAPAQPPDPQHLPSQELPQASSQTPNAALSPHLYSGLPPGRGEAIALQYISSGSASAGNTLVARP